MLKAEERQTGRMAAISGGADPGESRDNLGRFLGLTEADLLRTAHMESAAVASAFRGHGLQGRMMAEAERMLRERGFSWLMGTVHRRTFTAGIIS